MNSHELRKHKANIKKKLIVAYLIENGPMKQTDITEMFSCGRALARKATDEAKPFFDGSKKIMNVEEKKKVTAEKIKKIAAHLKKNGYMSQDKIMSKFKCGKDVAHNAQVLSGKYVPPGRDRKDFTYLDVTMHRPNGINYLTRAWV